MTFAAEKVKVGRLPAILVEMDLDECALTYGIAPCTASAGSGNECINSRQTCQDTANFDNTSTKTLQFSSVLIPGEPYLHCVESATLAPTVINPNKGLGQRASIRIMVNDFPHHDRGIDPYIANRSYDATAQGSYWTKFQARQRHFAGRPLRIKSGYIADPFNASDFQTRNYIIDSISGPDAAGRFTIGAKDVLKLADDKRAQAPIPTTGVLVADITDVATSLTVTSGTESEYTAEGDYLRIGEEVIQSPVANRSSNVFSNLTRGAFNTTAEAHELGDGVQSCKYLNAVNVVDLVEDLLENYASVPTAYIVDADWDAERDNYYSSAVINTVISKPTGVTELVNQLAKQFFFQIWWNEIDQEIIFHPIVPPRNVAVINEFNDDQHLIDKSVVLAANEESRLTRVLVYYNPSNPIDIDDPENYQGIYVIIEADAESAAEYNDIRQEVILAHFVDSEALAVQVGGRLLNRFRNVPRMLNFKLDTKDATDWTGNYIDINSARIVGEGGANKVTRFQVTSVQEVTAPLPGTVYQYKAIELNFTGNYGYIGPNTLGEYSAEDDADRANYAFISPATGIFADLTTAYRII